MPTLFIRLTLMIVVLLFLNGCSMISNRLAATTGGGGGLATTNVAGENIFSDIRELSSTPPQKEYAIGVSDLLEIKVFQAPELSQSVRVDQRGFITLPLIESVQAQGLSQAGLEQSIAQKLSSKWMQDPQVTVFIKEANALRVTIEGEVKKPNVYPMKSSLTALQAIALAGGPTSLAAPDRIVLFRKDGTRMKAYRLDLNSIRSGQVADPYLENDDRIVVHRSNSRFWLKEVAPLVSPISILNRMITG